jgi:hypothetical protein
MINEGIQEICTQIGDAKRISNYQKTIKFGRNELVLKK